MKTCFKCGEAKQLSEYYAHKQMAEGHLNKCKSCTQKDTKDRTAVKIQDPGWAEDERTRHRVKYHRLDYREKHKPTGEDKKRAILAYKERYPEKVAAKSKLKPAPSGFQYHHWSYQKEHHKCVILLKVDDHYLLHRFIRYDQPYMAYRTLSGTLLDTRERHIEYARSILQENGVADLYF